MTAQNVKKMDEIRDEIVKLEAGGKKWEDLCHRVPARSAATGTGGTGTGFSSLHQS